MQQVGALPARPLLTLEETVVAVRELLHGETVTRRAGPVRMEAVRLKVPPSVVPDVLIGSTGPRGIDVARRAADGILLPEGCGPDAVEWATTDTPRRSFSCVVYAWLSVDENPELARRRVAPAVADWARSDLYPHPQRLAGLQASARGSVDEALPRELSGRVAVVGDIADCAAALDRLYSAGADRVILVPQGPDLFGELVRVVEDVVPLISNQGVRRV